LKLGVEVSLLTAAARCILQLSVMASVLQKVFETQNPWAVAGIACLLNLLATAEVTVNKSKRRFSGMFPAVLLAMAGSTIPISLLGSRFAMESKKFWAPETYIPILGMLCGATISGVVVSVTTVLREVQDNKDKVETYLAFGASRFEACRPIATEALKVALTPNVNQMSVIGLISIPGMMTGAILGGSSVEQAARLQMVILFMINAATALASIMATVLALRVVVDSEHRVRIDRIDDRKAIIWRTRDRALGSVVDGTRLVGRSVWGRLARRGEGGALLG